MTDLQWHDFLGIGVDFIDSDHRELLKIMLEAKIAIEEGDDIGCVLALNSLVKEAKDHFTREEEYLSEVKYPGLEEHKIYHKELLVKAEITKRICEGIETEHDLKECFEHLTNFLIDDILRGDIMFKSYLKYKGYIKRK